MESVIAASTAALVTGYLVELALRARDETGTDQVDGQEPPQ